MKLSLCVSVLAFSLLTSITPGRSQDDQLWGTTSKGGQYSNGTIFKIGCGALNHAIVYEFPDAATNGSHPYSSLVLHSNGKLYGTTYDGGANNRGVIFEIDPTTGTYTKKLDLSTTTGGNPDGSLVEGPGGLLFGTTPIFGGGAGVLYEYNPTTNNYIVRKSFQGSSGENPVGTPIYASNGKIYGMTKNAGTTAGTLYEYDPVTNAFAVKINFSLFSPTGDYPWIGQNPESTLMQASNGKVYGLIGASSITGGLFEYDITTGVVTPLHHFPSDGSEGAGFFAAFCQASDGMLYGMSSNGGASVAGNLFKWDPSTSQISFLNNFQGTGSAYPRGSLMEAGGFLWGVTIYGGTGMGTIFKYDRSTNMITKLMEFNDTNGKEPNFVKFVKVKVDQTVSFSTIGAKTYGDVEFDLLGSSPAGDLTFTSADPTIASVSGNKVTIHKAGSVMITANNAGSCLYNSGSATQTLNISKATLTATAENKEKTYGADNPALTISYSGFVYSDTQDAIDQKPTTTTTATKTSNAGDYTITPDNGSDDNYNFAYVDGKLSIAKATLTVTAADKSKTYGDANPQLTFTYSGFVNSETETVLDTKPVVSTDATVASNAGDYTIVVKDGIDNNYTLTYTNATLRVNKAHLVAVADNKARAYYAADPEFTIQYSGFLNGETESVIDTKATATTNALQSSDVGDYTITPAEASDNNYSFSYTTGTFKVTKRTLHAKADDKTRVYGQVNPEGTITYEGFAGTDNEGVLDQLPYPVITTTTSSDVGSFPISVSPGSDNNYTFVYQNGNITITKALLSVAADSNAKIYGEDNPELTYNISGFLLGQSESVIDLLPTATTTATSSSNAGNYPISVGDASDNNYSFEYIDGSLRIEKAELIITAKDATTVYGTAFHNFQVEYSGFIPGDDENEIDHFPVMSSNATVASPVGDYDIVLQFGDDNNYAFVFVNGKLSITKKDLTITAKDQSRTYGQPNPTFTLKFDGLVNNDTATDIDQLPGTTTTENETSKVGTYDIIVTGGIDNNYNITTSNGTLTITPAHQTITFSVSDKSLDDQAPAIVATSNSGLPVTVISNNSKASIANSTVILNEAGKASLTASQPGSDNYLAADPVTVQFCINPRKPSITSTGQNTALVTLSSSSQEGNQWFLNDRNISNASSKTYAASASGVYKVQVTVDACVSPFSDPADVVVTGEIAETISLKFYTNPATSVLYVAGLSSDASFSITDMTGRSHQVSSSYRSSMHEVNVDQLSAGFYILHSSSGQKLRFLKK